MKAINQSELWKKRLGDWVINPYVGCEHGCRHCYCPAMPGVRAFNGGQPQEAWGNYLIPKEGFVEALRKQLRTFTPDKAKRTEWGEGWVLASFLTDPYTPAEAQLKMTRQSLQLLLEAGHKVRILTRSVLIERDFDLLLAHRERVLVGTSLPYFEDGLARVLEPRAAGPSRRFAMLNKAATIGLRTYISVAPVMPWSLNRLDEIFAYVIPFPCERVFCEVLNPKGSNLKMMESALHGRPERGELVTYDAKKWAEATYSVAWYGHRNCRNFIAWPDTSRNWAKHLQPGHVAWLDQWLPRCEHKNPSFEGLACDLVCGHRGDHSGSAVLYPEFRSTPTRHAWSK